MRCCYYSPYGGTVQAVLNDRDPALDLQVVQGQLARCDVEEDHALCHHIDDPKQPTHLDGWHGYAATRDPETNEVTSPAGIAYRQPGFMASVAPPAAYAAAALDAARLRAEVRELRELIQQALALPGRLKPAKPLEA